MDYHGDFGINRIGDVENSLSMRATMVLNRQQNATPDQVLVLGMGITGLSCVRFLYQRGAKLVVMDDRTAPPHLEQIRQLYPDITVSTGGFDARLLAQVHSLVVSPGIDLRDPFIQNAKTQGKIILGDIELFARHVNAPVVAITGSNGKSTVTTLVGQMAQQDGKTVRVGGNLGTAALDLLGEPAPDFYVLELSSFQLDTTDSLTAHAAVVLNLSEDHLDRYTHAQEYYRSKLRVYRGCRHAIVNLDDAWLKQQSLGVAAPIYFSLNPDTAVPYSVASYRGQDHLWIKGQAYLPCEQIAIKGAHNIANSLAAVALAHTMGVSDQAIQATLRTFKGLAHRCQLVRIHREVSWFNDSKGTNVGASIAAIEGMAKLTQYRRVWLIAGGVGKGQDFKPLVAVAQRYLHGVILLGQAAEEISQVLNDALPVWRVTGMAEAVQKVADLAQPQDAVLLSPACASFDQYRNYQERGEHFTQLVNGLNHGTA